MGSFVLRTNHKARRKTILPRTILPCSSLNTCLTRFFLLFPKQMPTPFHEIPIIDRQLIKLADPTTSLSINTPANYTVVSPRSIHSSCVVYPCAWIDARPFFPHYRTNCRFTHAHGTEREKGREIERKREREKGKKIGGNSSVLSRLESKST